MRETGHWSGAMLLRLLHGKFSEERIIPSSYRIISAKGPAKKVKISFQETEDHTEYLIVTVLQLKWWWWIKPRLMWPSWTHSYGCIQVGGLVTPLATALHSGEQEECSYCNCRTPLSQHPGRKSAFGVSIQCLWDWNRVKSAPTEWMRF